MYLYIYIINIPQMYMDPLRSLVLVTVFFMETNGVWMNKTPVSFVGSLSQILRIHPLGGLHFLAPPAPTWKKTNKQNQTNIKTNYMDVSKNRWILPPKWTVKILWKTLFFNGWFGGTIIFGNTHMSFPSHHPVNIVREWWFGVSNHSRNL